MDAEAGAEQIFVRQDIARLEERVRKLTEENAALRDENRTLKHDQAVLMETIAKLRRNH